jgi:hypothetical protein
MTIHFLCSSCNTPTQAENRLAGRTLKCFTCGGLFVVPPAPAAEPVAVPAPSFEPAVTAPFDPGVTAPFELEEEADPFAAEAPVAAVQPDSFGEDDIDIAALLEEEPAVDDYAADDYEATAVIEDLEAMEVADLEPEVEEAAEMDLDFEDVVEEPEPKPRKKGKK